MFERFIRNARTDRYNNLCSIDAHEKEYQSSCDDGIIGGGCPLPSNSTAEALDSLGSTIYFIGCWLKSSEQNFRKNENHYYMLVDVVVI